MKFRIFLILLVILVPLLTGCPGNRTVDKEARTKLGEWIDQQDAAVWTITGFEGTAYTGVVTTYEFRYSILDIAINSEAMNPVHQRNWMEGIARKWREFYPANKRPRFNLKVVLYDKEINNDFELGWVEIDQEGNLDTHHARTQDTI